MKLAIAFLAFGAALAIPQNFYLSFHPPKNQFLPAADSSSQNAFRGPLNLDSPYQRNGYGFLPKSPFGNSFYDESDLYGANDHRPQVAGNVPSLYSSQDEDGTEARNGVQSRFLFGGGGGNGVGVGFYPFFPNFSRKFITIYAYSSTVNFTLTMPVVSTCIPVASFSTSAATGTACTAAGRKRRSFWDDEVIEAIHPSNVEDVVATAVEELPSIDRPVRDLRIESSQDDQQIDTPKMNRRKRFFFGFAPTITLTSILTTVSTSTTFTQITNTTTLTQYSSFTCLPPGTVVCK